MADMQRWLLRARGINAKIDALDELIERAKSRLEGGGSRGGGGGGGSRKPGGLDKYLIQIETYKSDREKMVRIRDEVYDAICMLENNVHQSALISYYITGRDWEDIAADLGKDRTTIYRWHKKALLDLENILEIAT